MLIQSNISGITTELVMKAASKNATDMNFIKMTFSQRDIPFNKSG